MIVLLIVLLLLSVLANAYLIRKRITEPTLIAGEEKDQKFDAKKIRYNFQTNKGISYDATTTEKDLYVLGEKAAFFGENKEQNQKEENKDER